MRRRCTGKNIQKKEKNWTGKVIFSNKKNGFVKNLIITEKVKLLGASASPDEVEEGRDKAAPEVMAWVGMDNAGLPSIH